MTTLSLKYSHDFSENAGYPCPYVLVYKGKETELMDISIFCQGMFDKKLWTAGVLSLTEHPKNQSPIFIQPFHFVEKKHATLVRLRF